MTDGFKQFETDGSEELSDERLRAYLLGELREDERLRLDQRLLTDDAVAERVRLAEAQLVDEYVAGELDPQAAGVFHTRFLKTDARREQVRLTGALRDYSAQSEAAVPVPQPAARRSWREAFSEFFALKPGPAWAAAGSFALLVLVLAGAWYLSRQSRQTETPVAYQPPVNAASPAATRAPAVAHVQPTASPTPPQLKPSPSEPPVAVASFVLLPGALRGPGEMTRVAVPRGERAILRLSLVLENPSPGTYQAELANADGKTVTVRKNLRPHRNGQTKITLDLPARLVQPDDYQVKLTRQADGQLESVGRYYFRALPE
ncbi:MAG TPA: hypothetical protein VFX97_11095 [Pyrinomonadaceae bacterium]|nr:hypothetical protein [Pyrinomonadaceae bacterium]